ncbi:BRISC and BRCA1-A complex member 1 isoform X2 [Protopterus annectens]|uniref:BRISC and BRCA1-A complex member 1 isoform X2 n=1 Tax=Protopterus annectens TaxID=7888 RepID=UPI001CF96A16|nr:BRISC and BRCA1-A complex member 1 isoform X2 [Protopterus annectens]
MMDTSETENVDGEEPTIELRPRTRSNPEGAEDRRSNPQSIVGSRSEGEGEAASTETQTSAPTTTNATERIKQQAPSSTTECHVKTPRVNCPEKVIICLDLSEEMSLQKLESFNGSKANALNISQKMIEMFVRTKHKIDKRHEFALLVMNDDATWLSGFTSDPREVCSCLYDLETNICETFNLEGLFNLIQQKIDLPVTENIHTIPPPYVVRAVLIYSRAPSQQQFTVTESMKILQSAYFFFDVIYIHNGAEEKDEEVSWKDTFSFFGNLDPKGTSYKYDVSLTGPAVELHNCMAKLLSHPLQRPFQMHASYSLLEDEEPIETEATV